MEDRPGDLGAECRTLREKAGVSLEDLARRVHRDPSSLSRFERGLSRPRDLVEVVEIYRSLRPRGQVETHETHEPKAPDASARPPLAHSPVFLGWVFGRWILLAIAEIAVQPLPSRALQADVLRLFGMASAVGALVVVVLALRRQGWWPPDPLPALTVITRDALPMMLLLARSLMFFGSQDMDLPLYIAGLAWIEGTYWVWGFDCFGRIYPRHP